MYAHNHDQVGNRAVGDRLPRRLRSLAVLRTPLPPGIPMISMGDDDEEDTPFQFFTDHHDPLIADATRRGRRREFAQRALIRRLLEVGRRFPPGRAAVR